MRHRLVVSKTIKLDPVSVDDVGQLYHEFCRRYYKSPSRLELSIHTFRSVLSSPDLLKTKGHPAIGADMTIYGMEFLTDNSLTDGELKAVWEDR